ncbi:hypothetical protein [Nocardiopsis sp. CNR-923]|uniref:hypothetical protein n=1 Tax=Nocardiopsis sp. CNR-923 TaxID=1904965 RepID=UPI001300DAB2|nr:hypothetical protein [Nocardiopsis sp. CNR-923]
MLHSAAIDDGGAVLNRMLLTALAEHAQVVQSTVGDVGAYGNVEVVALAGDGLPLGVDDRRTVLKDVHGADNLKPWVCPRIPTTSTR